MNSGSERGASADLTRLIEQRDYPALESALASRVGISERERKLFGGVLANRRNRLAEAIALLAPLLRRPAASLEFAQRRIGYETLADCYAKLFRYREAARTLEQAQRNLKATLDRPQALRMKQTWRLMHLLRTVRRQAASIPGPFEVPLDRRGSGHLDIPVEIGGTQWSWMLDTGANFSVVTESLAKALRLKLLAGAAVLTRADGVEVPIRLAVVSSLTVGPARFENVIVLVVADHDFRLPARGPGAHGVLGYPVLAAMERLTITGGRTLAVRSSVELQSVTTTLWLEGFTPLILALIDDRPRLFVLDSGARHSYLSVRFFENNRWLAGRAPGRISLRGGGRPRWVSAYKVARLALRFGRDEVVMKDVPVAAAKTGTITDDFYGIVGQDLLERFEHYRLDFGNMTMSMRAKRR